MAVKAVAAAYARRIKRGEITIDQVPISIRDEVCSILDTNQNGSN